MVRRHVAIGGRVGNGRPGRDRFDRLERDGHHDGHDAPARPGVPRETGARGGAAGPRHGHHRADERPTAVVGPATTVEGGTSAAVFLACLERVVVSNSAPAQAVVLNHRAAHRSRRVAGVVHAAGCPLVHLPAYFSDLNPTEEANRLVEALRRAAGARTRPAPDHAVAGALGAVTPADARGWLAHAGCWARPP